MWMNIVVRIERDAAFAKRIIIHRVLMVKVLLQAR